jgi:hypothetical protein
MYSKIIPSSKNNIFTTESMKWNECIKNIIKTFILHLAENAWVCLLGLKEEDTKKDGATYSERIIFIGRTIMLSCIPVDGKSRVISVKKSLYYTMRDKQIK